MGNKRTMFAPDKVDTEIKRVLQAASEQSATSADELLIQRVHQYYLPGDYELSLRRVKQRLESPQEQVSDEMADSLQSLLSQPQRLTATRSRSRWHPLGLLAAAVLAMMLVGGMVTLLSHVHSNTDCSAKSGCSGIEAGKTSTAAIQPPQPVLVVTTVVDNYEQMDNGDEIISRVDPTTGKALWQFVVPGLHIVENGGLSEGNPVTYYQEVNGIVYFLAENSDGNAHTYYALKASDGTVVWKKTYTSDYLWNDPVIANGVAYIVQTQFQPGGGTYPLAGPVTLTAFNAVTGQQLWQQKYQGDLHAFTIVATNSTTLFATTWKYTPQATNWQLYALNANGGTMLWQKTFTAAPDEIPNIWQIVNGTLYEISWISPSSNQQTGVSHVRAFSAATGQEVWHITLTDTANSLQLLGNTLYITTNPTKTTDSLLYAVDLSGHIVWQKSARGQWGAMGYEYINGNLYIERADNDGYYLDALRSSDGSLFWESQVGESSGLQIANNQIYLGITIQNKSGQTSNQIQVLAPDTGNIIKTIALYNPQSVATNMGSYILFVINNPES
jgi:outer membrane protein assembly factor BamB